VLPEKALRRKRGRPPTPARNDEAQVLTHMGFGQTVGIECRSSVTPEVTTLKRLTLKTINQSLPQELRLDANDKLSLPSELVHNQHITAQLICDGFTVIPGWYGILRVLPPFIVEREAA
jgi:hypothetical protein